MRTKNASAITPAERAHLELVKLVGCVVCPAPAPNHAHHTEQDNHWTTIAVCDDCHGGPGHPHGWHGDRSRWRVAKMTENKALNETLRRVDALRSGRPITPSTPARSRQHSTRTPAKQLPRDFNRRAA